jgi:hypothetical protein
MKRQRTGACLGSLLLIGASTFGAGQVSVAPAPGAAGTFSTEAPASVNLVASDSSKLTAAPTPNSINALPDAPSAVSQDSAQQGPAVASAVEQPAPAKLKAPANQTVGTTFLISNGLLLGSTILNVEMISRCRPSACQAVPDAIRNRGDLYGIGIPSSLAVSYISYRLKKSGTRMWFLPVAVLTAGNVIYAAHAAQNSNSSGVARSAARRR